MSLIGGFQPWLGASLVALGLTTSAERVWAEERAWGQPSAGRNAEDQHSDTGTLSHLERAQLRSGNVVERPLRFEDDGGRYVGGVSYQVVRAQPAVVLQELARADNLPHMLPFTLAARVIERRSDATFIELTQGKAPFVGRYTVQLVREEDQLSFWLDRERPRNIEDLWGYFRARPFEDGTTLLTVAVALDLGAGVTRWLFEDKIQRVVLSTPRKIRQYVESRSPRPQPAFAAR